MRRALLGALLLAALACGKDEQTGPVAGDLTVAYGSPVATDGAIMLLVTGGPVTSVTPLSGYTAVSAPAGTNITRIVVTGNLATGDVVRLAVPDLGTFSSYGIRVEAVANRNTFALADPNAYTAGIRK